LSKEKVAKGATYLYFETLIAMFSGYGFWILMSKLVAPEVIGVSSALISLAVIFMTAATIGIPVGIQRFLAKSFSERESEDARVYLMSSLILICVGIILSCLALLFVYNLFYEYLEMDFSLIVVGLAYIASYALVTLFRSIVIATLTTKSLPLVALLSAGAKFVLAFVLVMIGTGALGVTIGFTSFSIVGSVLLAFTIASVTKTHTTLNPSNIQLKTAIKNTLEASVSSWIPTLIYSIGAHLGPLLVFGSHGANEAGVYFIAFSIVIAISALMSALFSIAYPALSAMRDGRKRFTWRTIKISLVISLPLSFSLIFYSEEILQFFGQDYAEGSLPLGILLISLLPYAVTAGVNNLVYSYGNYRYVLAIGLGASLTRTGLYFVLVPFFDSTGAAFSYTIGAIVGFIVSVIIAKRVGLQIHWYSIALISIIPSALGFMCSYFHLQYPIGISITLTVSYLLLLKLGVISKTDIQDSFSIIPNQSADKLARAYRSIRRKIR
jgi:O-antigen/teichoic acid export membrane protein